MGLLQADMNIRLDL